MFKLCDRIVNSILVNRPKFTPCGGAFDGLSSDIYAICFSEISLVSNEISKDLILQSKVLDIVGGVTGCLLTIYVVRYKVPQELINLETADLLDSLIDLSVTKLLNSIELVKEMNTGISHVILEDEHFCSKTQEWKDTREINCNSIVIVKLIGDSYKYPVGYDKNKIYEMEPTDLSFCCDLSGKIDVLSLLLNENSEITFKYAQSLVRKL
ncbi:hypothetical protein ACTFIT_006745 [Dictyostelium discoideum]